MPFLVLSCVIIGLLYWLITAYSGLQLSSIPTLRLPTSQRSAWPHLTVIVPACNEAAEIEDAAGTLLNQDYPNLQLIFVDDRSTDTTGEIVDNLASIDPRVEAIHINELPDQWLGKVHALHTGLQQATGDIVLFTDADVHFADGALKAAVDHFLNAKLDHLAGFPRLNPSGLFLGAMLAAFLRQFVTVMRPWKVSDPGCRAFIGIGAFNMVKKQQFLAAGGFEWLRMEVGDDVGVGLMMKRSGYRCDAARMSEWLSLYWHRSIGSAVRGTEKGWSSVCRFSVPLTIILGFLNTAMELAPLCALLLMWPSLRLAGWLGVFIMGIYFFASMIFARWMRQPILPHLLSIFTAPFGFAVMVRTAVVGYCRGGALWRGTLYPTEALKSGMRLKFPW
jgi:cellulose synthase/poly-beta-1,6-N-acetylglucosamine synthase-like glycosyltransferase